MIRPSREAWEAAFSKLHAWLAEDRARREVCIKADDEGEIWQVFLYVDEEIVSLATGMDLPSTIDEAMMFDAEYEDVAPYD
ncbi:MAG TPA: hypothetical protein VKB24_09980 [Candidatus Acidoferrum sp.]|nr:hypothetical protein [Candidatus Acidoferrum sp.]